MPILSPTEMIQQKLGPDPKNYTSDAVRALLMQQARAQNQGADTGMPDFITDVAGEEAGPPTRAVAKRRAAGGAAPNGMGAAIARSMSAPEGPNSTPPSDIPPSQMNDYNTPVRSAPVGNVGQQVVQGAPITRPGQTVGSDYAQPVDDVNRVINDDPGYRTTGDRTVSAAPVAPPPAPPVPPSTTTSAPPGPVSAAIDKAVDTASPSTVKAPDPPPAPDSTGPAAGIPVSPNDVGQLRPPGTVMPTASQLPGAIQSLITDAGGLVPDNQAAQAALALAAIGGPAAATVLGPMAARRLTGGPSPSGISAEANQLMKPDPNAGAPRPAPSGPAVTRPGSTGAVGTAPATLPNAPPNMPTTGATIVSNQPAAASAAAAPAEPPPAPKAAEPPKAEPPKQQSGSQSRDAARGRAQAASQARAGPPSASYSGIKQPAAGEPSYVEGVKPVGSAAARAPTGGPGVVVDKGMGSAFQKLQDVLAKSLARSQGKVGAGIPFVIPPLGKMTPDERAKAVVDQFIRRKK